MAKPLIGITPDLKAKLKRGDAHLLYNSYVDLIVSAGGLPVILPIVGAREEARELLERLDGLVLTGGDDIDPSYFGQAARHMGSISPRERTDSDLAFARVAAERGTPSLGICLGVQSMNVAFGGTLLQYIPEDAPGALRHEEDEDDEVPTHAIAIEPGTLLRRALGVESTTVNSFHHQAVAQLATGFRVAARSPDGIVEAIERQDH